MTIRLQFHISHHVNRYTIRENNGSVSSKYINLDINSLTFLIFKSVVPVLSLHLLYNIYITLTTNYM